MSTLPVRCTACLSPSCPVLTISLQLEYVSEHVIELTGKTVMRVNKIESADFVVLWLEPECKLKKRKKEDDEQDGTEGRPKPTALSVRPLIPKKARCT